uniref:Lipoprotein n=1 Tax=uncultured Alphaproteobacteria bacterium TaxID=91750 RepID=A0A6G8F2C4_9PROT|nr:hypothetical protein PlAlph_0720 [uncultured Alphaproteobacteria bacterium]
MQKFFIITLVCLIAAGCSKFQSEETPIDETEGLVTYTAPNTTSVGIKKAGEEQPLTDAVYTCIHSCFGCLIAEREPDANDEVTFDMLDAASAARLSNLSYDGVMAVAEGFVLEKADDLYFLARGTTCPEGPKQQILFRDSLVFTQSGNKWGVYGITADKYDKIAVIRQNGTSGFYLAAQDKENVLLLDDGGKIVRQGLSLAIFDKLDRQSQKFAGKKWGDDTIFGMTVANFKASL